MSKLEKVRIGWLAWGLVTGTLVVLFGLIAGTHAHSLPASAPSSQSLATVSAAPARAPASQAAPVVVKLDDMKGTVDVITSATRTSNWRLAVCGLMLLCVYLLRRVGGMFWPALTTDRAGALLALAAGLLVVLVNALAAGKGFDPQILIDGVLAGLTAAGGWTVTKKALAPAK